MVAAYIGDAIKKEKNKVKNSGQSGFFDKEISPKEALQIIADDSEESSEEDDIFDTDNSMQGKNMGDSQTTDINNLVDLELIKLLRYCHMLE